MKIRSIPKKISSILTIMASDDPPLLSTEPASPLIMSVVNRQQGMIKSLSSKLDAANNEYDRYDIIAKLDDRVAELIFLMSVMVQKSYAGIGLREDDKEVTETEKNILKTAKEFAENKNIDIESRFFDYTGFLLKYGDVVERIITRDNITKTFSNIDLSAIERIDDEESKQKRFPLGILALDPLPRNQLTVIDKRDRLEKSGVNDPQVDDVISRANFYVIDEKNRDQREEDPMVIKESEILHIPFNNRGNWKKDLMDRPTFNIWSNSPLESIFYLVEWKHNLIINDILWKERMLPREVYNLDMSLFVPDNFPGDTYDDRVANAKKAAEKALNDFAAKVVHKKPDQPFVLPDSVKVGIVESKSANYHEPNNLIDQIDGKISGLIGAPSALQGGEGSSGGFTALVHSSTFLSLRAEIIARKLCKWLEWLIQKHVQMVHPSVSSKTIKRLFIKKRLILDRDLLERAKVVSVLRGTNTFTPTELREIMGKDAMTDVQEKELFDFIIKSDPKTAGTSSESVSDDVGKVSGTNPTQEQKSQGKIDADETDLGGRTGEGSFRNLTRQ